jgi:aromatic ring-opening dioxygenase catalytic subunit (LigB family)
MDELANLFSSMGVSTNVLDIINQDMIVMAQHYIQQSNSHIEFSPNPICEYTDNDLLNTQILQHINTKGEKILKEKILLLSPSTIITEIDLNTYITYYVSLLESSIS